MDYAKLWRHLYLKILNALRLRASEKCKFKMVAQMTDIVEEGNSAFGWKQ